MTPSLLHARFTTLFVFFRKLFVGGVSQATDESECIAFISALYVAACVFLGTAMYWCVLCVCVCVCVCVLCVCVCVCVADRLKAYFAQFGPVSEVELKRDQEEPTSKRHRCVGPS